MEVKLLSLELKKVKEKEWGWVLEFEMAKELEKE
jgi:hypothetical protein